MHHHLWSETRQTGYSVGVTVRLESALPALHLLKKMERAKERRSSNHATKVLIVLVLMQPRSRLVYFYFLRVNFLVKTSTSGRRDQVRLPWQRYTCQSKYGCFRSSPQVTYLQTKNEGGL